VLGTSRTARSRNSLGYCFGMGTILPRKEVPTKPDGIQLDRDNDMTPHDTVPDTRIDVPFDGAFAVAVIVSIHGDETP
jgi:hypothetical protein